MTETAPMPSDSTVQSAHQNDAAPESLRNDHAAAWRNTFAAALRVMDHHRAHLEANLTIRRLRRDEQRAAPGPAGSSVTR